MEISPVFFYLFAVLAVAFSFNTVLNKSPIASAFSLVMVFFSFGGIYALLGAHLIAAMQILVYTGDVMVLFVFVVMLLNSDEVSLDTSKNNNFFSLATLLLAGAMFFLTVWSIKNGKMAVPKDTHTALKVLEMGGNTRVISRAMFSEYILPFELTSILLLTGIVGAITMAKRKHKKQIK